ncbi:sugar ABC transporter ATP-binding protein [Butyrivibrio sp. MC2013]|uniref:sugar ABC transporter ATP-binding protein n=1 Tax=Butyrivibrio sp. MC2013 TaxID=1280686 RepID=UPI00041107D0|nr:sugar ABC transporter ATP-binding protein [Butyrivibrio sp. MC2013]
MEKAPLLEMKNIKKDFFGNQVLSDINLTLHEGEVVGLVGENGAGKSTLMKILFGADVIRETGGYGGDILINSKKVDFQSPFDAIAAGIGMVHQEFSLIPGFSATENILLNREDKRTSVLSKIVSDRMDILDRNKMDDNAQEAIQKMGVNIDRNMKINNMPVGHRQFTEIARELSKEQLKLLILDEPTAVLTEKEAEALLESIRGMSKRGIAVIFITHRLNEILAVCDKVVTMRDGYVVNESPAKDTSVKEITQWMVGRSVSAAAAPKEQDDRVRSDKTILSVRKLWVDMPGETVRNVDLDVKEGEILGIGGLAGQGKLGIPNGIMGLYQAGGEVEFGGESIALNNPRKCLDEGFAFVSEDRRGVGLLLDESLEWNVSFPAMQIQNKYLKTYLGGLIKWRDDATIKEVTDRYIDELKIKCRDSKQKAKELSGGNQQKVCLAKAFALEPKLLFVSEPTRGIDVGAKALVLEALKKFNREKKVTIVMVSSELEELRQTCDRIAIVSGGKVAGILPAAESSEKFGELMLKNC